MIKKGLFVGLTTIDIQYFLDGYPKPNTKVKTNKPYLSAGGPAANAAITFSFLGGKADFITFIGENSFKSLIYNDIESNKVNLIDVMNGEQFDPIIASIITTTSNSNRTIITSNPNKLPVNKDFSNIYIDNYDFIFVDGFYPELAIPVCKKAKQIGIPVIFDGGSWKPQLIDLLPFVDIAICSENFSPPPCTTRKQIFKYLKNIGVIRIAITRGKHSIVLEDSEIAVIQMNTIDSLGAGDIFHGAFCWYWCQNYDWENDLNRASKVASFSTKYKGTRTWMKAYFE